MELIDELEAEKALNFAPTAVNAASRTLRNTKTIKKTHTTMATNPKSLLSLSESEMLTLWKKILNLDVPNTDCDVQRIDGIDLDATIWLHIRQWYAHLLQTAPLHMVPVEDMLGSATITTQADSATQVQLPARCVRPVEVRMLGWKRSVTEFLSPDHPVAKMQSNALLRAGTENPVVVAYDNRLELYPSATTGLPAAVEILRAVAAPADGSFAFSPEALDTIKQFEQSL